MSYAKTWAKWDRKRYDPWTYPRYNSANGEGENKDIGNGYGGEGIIQGTKGCGRGGRGWPRRGFFRGRRGRGRGGGRRSYSADNEAPPLPVPAESGSHRGQAMDKTRGKGRREHISRYGGGNGGDGAATVVPLQYFSSFQELHANANATMYRMHSSIECSCYTSSSEFGSGTQSGLKDAPTSTTCTLVSKSKVLYAMNASQGSKRMIVDSQYPCMIVADGNDDNELIRSGILGDDPDARLPVGVETAPGKCELRREGHGFVAFCGSEDFVNRLADQANRGLAHINATSSPAPSTADDRADYAFAVPIRELHRLSNLHYKTTTPSYLEAEWDILEKNIGHKRVQDILRRQTGGRSRHKAKTSLSTTNEKSAYNDQIENETESKAAHSPICASTETQIETEAEAPLTPSTARYIATGFVSCHAHIRMVTSLLPQSMYGLEAFRDGRQPDDYILLIAYYDSQHDAWFLDIPGGKRWAWESSFEGMVREMSEESSLLWSNIDVNLSPVPAYEPPTGATASAIARGETEYTWTTGRPSRVGLLRGMGQPEEESVVGVVQYSGRIHGISRASVAPDGINEFFFIREPLARDVPEITSQIDDLKITTSLTSLSLEGKKNES
jgi:hypothetical protein